MTTDVRSSGRASDEQGSQGEHRESAPSAAGSALPIHSMVVKAAREMVRIHAEACNVNRDDLWAIEGQSFIDEAQSVLDACGAPELLEALKEMERTVGLTPFARAAMRKATGGAV